MHTTMNITVIKVVRKIMIEITTPRLITPSESIGMIIVTFIQIAMYVFQFVNQSLQQSLHFSGPFGSPVS